MRRITVQHWRNAALFVSCLYSFTSITAQDIEQATPSTEASLEFLQSATPDQIRTLRKKLDELQKASAERPNGLVTGEARTLSLRFRGGQAAHTVDLVTGRLTVIGIYDRFMRPLAIENVRFSDREGFEIFTRGEGTNSFTIQPILEYAKGNLVVFLVGEPEPLVLDLNTVENKYASKINVQLDILSPESRQVSIHQRNTPLSKENTDGYLSFIDGRPPEGATPVNIGISNTEAWAYGSELVVLTSNEIYAPPPRARLSTPDKQTLFVLSRVNQLVMSTPKGALEVSEVNYE